MNIWSWLYSSLKIKPVLMLIPTWCICPARQVGPCFPFAESVLSDGKIQSHVHNCVVQVHKVGQVHSFCVFFKWHSRLPNNWSLSLTTPFQGNIVVMWVGALDKFLVDNMRGRDTVVSDYMVNQYLCAINQYWHWLLPNRFVCKICSVKRFLKVVTFRKQPLRSRYGCRVGK